MNYENEKDIRMDFARLFHWYKKRGQYDYQDELRIPEWSEIFHEIGKLQAFVTTREVEGNVSELECKVADIENRLDSHGIYD